MTETSLSLTSQKIFQHAVRDSKANVSGSSGSFLLATSDCDNSVDPDRTEQSLKTELTNDPLSCWLNDKSRGDRTDIGHQNMIYAFTRNYSRFLLRLL